MRANNKTPDVSLRLSLLVVVYLLSGCGATEQASELPECREGEAVECAAEEGDDRSYDPCLINKKLPVCKS